MANALIVALAKAQQKFEPIIKNRKNYNKGEYADLTAILNAVKPALLESGVVVLQSPTTRYVDDGGFAVDIMTTLYHGESGEHIESVLTMPCKSDAQSVGSAITYGRRYALVSMLSLSSEDDDDGEEAIKGNGQQPQRQQRAQRPPQPSTQQRRPTATNDASAATLDAFLEECRTLHLSSSGMCSDKQYKYLVGIINQNTAETVPHNAVFEAMVGRPVDSENRIGMNLARALFDWFVESKNGVPNENYDPAYEVRITELAQRIQGQLQAA